MFSRVTLFLANNFGNEQFRCSQKTFMPDDIELNPGPSQNKNSQTRILLPSHLLYILLKVKLKLRNGSLADFSQLFHIS